MFILEIKSSNDFQQCATPILHNVIYNVRNDYIKQFERALTELCTKQWEINITCSNKRQRLNYRFGLDIHKQNVVGYHC